MKNLIRATLASATAIVISLVGVPGAGAQLSSGSSLFPVVASQQTPDYDLSNVDDRARALKQVHEDYLERGGHVLANSAEEIAHDYANRTARGEFTVAGVVQKDVEGGTVLIRALTPQRVGQEIAEYPDRQVEPTRATPHSGVWVVKAEEAYFLAKANLYQPDRLR